MTKKPTPAPIALRRAIRALALGLAITSASPLAAQVTPAFTYQGELRSGGNPANASFDMEFRLYGAATGGAQIGPVVTRPNVAAVNGLFNVQLDFGPAQFAGDRQWLEVRIKPAGSGSYESLLPRTEVTATPYALGAVAALANSVTTTSVVDGTLQAVDLAPGAVGATQIDSAQVQRRVSGSCNGSEGVQAIAADGSVSCGSFAGGSGTVTNVATGVGLTGGPITGSGTISVAPGGIGATEIDSAQVQRRVSGACAGANFVQQVNQDGSVGCGPGGAASGWSLNGNAGTDPATDFLGTTDAQPLVLRTQNEPSLRIEPSVGTGGVVISANILGGSSANSLTPGVRGATISGGGVPAGDSDPDLPSGSPNRITDHYGTIGGGVGNRAGDDAEPLFGAPFATIGGGKGNISSGNGSTVAGGWGNTAGDSLSSVGGGFFNIASGNSSTVVGGSGNTASGAAALAGGNSCTASGFAALALGDQTVASGRNAVALGHMATANLDNSFVWADGQVGSFSSVSANSFSVRAGGGVHLSPDTNQYFGSATRQMINLFSDSYGIGVQSSTLYHRVGSAASFSWYRGGVHSNDPNSPGTGGVEMMRLNSGGLRVNGTFVSSSDRELKQDVREIDPQTVLEKVAALPLSEWSFKLEPGTRHIGPMAQDFHAAFGVGNSDRHIATVDADGVALAAIQGLNAKFEAEYAALRAEAAEKLQQARAESAELRAELAELRRMVEAMATAH